MNQEIAWMRELHEAKELPVRDSPPVTQVAATETISMRRTLRTMTDGLIHDGMRTGNIVVTSKGVAATAMAATGPLVAMGQVPTFEEFLGAVEHLLLEARDVLDKGLTAHDWPEVRRGAVMVCTVCMGLCAATSIPYQTIVHEMIKSQMEGRPDMIGAILIEAGLIEVPTGEGNESEPSAV